MSLILDALKRAERERKAQASPALADLVRPPSAPAPVGRYWRMAGMALLTLIAGLLLWTALRDAPRPAPEAVTVTEPPAPPPSVIPGTEAVASLDDLTDEPVVEEMKPEPQSALPVTATPVPAMPQPGAETESAAPNAPEVGASRRGAGGYVPATPARDASSAAAPPEPAAAPAPVHEVPSALTQPAPLRKLREMPPDYRADFPALSVEVHVYERETAKRMVMINGRRYREGEHLAEGPLVMEIVREGIVFEHRGEKVLYTLGR